jgi:hypothetical protein
VLGYLPISAGPISDFLLGVTPPTPPVEVVTELVVLRGLLETSGEAGGYTVPGEFVPTAVPGFVGHPPKVSRFFGHPRPNQAYPPEFQSKRLDSDRQRADEDEILLVAFGPSTSPDRPSGGG